MGDTFYPKCVPFMIDEFERNLCLYYLNGLNSSQRIHMKFKPSSAYTVQDEDLLNE